jgi:hypothetical protein
MGRLIILFYLISLYGFDSLAQRFLVERNRFGVCYSEGFNMNRSNSDVFLVKDFISSVRSIGGLYEHQFSDLFGLRVGASLEFSKASFIDNSEDTIALFFSSSAPFHVLQSPMSYKEYVALHEKYTQTSGISGQFNYAKFRFSYLSMPFMAVFRSKPSKLNRYYFSTGVRLNLKIRTTQMMQRMHLMSDSVTFEYNNYKMLTTDDHRINSNLLFGIGFEHCYKGKSTVNVELQFDLPISNKFKSNSSDGTLILGSDNFPYFKIPNANTPYENNSLRQQQIRLSIGFLF